MLTGCSVLHRVLTKAMKEPTTKNEEALVRVVRHLSGTRNFGVDIQSGTDSAVLQVYADTDWAAHARGHARARLVGI